MFDAFKFATSILTPVPIVELSVTRRKNIPLAPVGFALLIAPIKARAFSVKAFSEKLAFPKGKRIDGVLHVRVVGGAATELQHLEPQVVERINAYFGYAAVGRLKLLHTPPIGPVTTPRQPIADKGGMGRLEPPLLSQKQTDTIKNSELRNALENLGRAIVTRSRR